MAVEKLQQLPRRSWVDLQNREESDHDALVRNRVDGVELRVDCAGFDCLRV